MKIYTRTGDDGTTGLFGGPRVTKCTPRIEAYGEVDELNSSLGVCRAVGLGSAADATLERLQSALFTLGAELAAPDPQTLGMALLGESDVAEVEAAIDQFDGSLAPLRSFILPGGTLAAAQLHVARCVCRRAERSMVALHEREPLRDVLLHYVNRVSDLLFVLARAANASAGVPDVPWQSPRKAGS